MKGGGSTRGSREELSFGMRDVIEIKHGHTPTHTRTHTHTKKQNLLTFYGSKPLFSIIQQLVLTVKDLCHPE